MTLDNLYDILPYAKPERVEEFYVPLAAAMEEFEITGAVREAAFIAQIAHESGSFHYTKELASGAAYEGRLDLGNTQPGDGKRFKGRGLIQITGRANYAKCGAALELDLIAQPELLEQTEPACRSAAWFWDTHGLNGLADAGNFERITKRINGGLNGYDERVAYWERAKAVLA